MRATAGNEPICSQCGGRMILRNGKYGKFYGCSGFPKCRNTQRFTEEQEPEQDFDPSDYQRAIFQFVKEGKGHGVVDAGAGSGKTTTIVQGLKYTPPTAEVAFLAFNRHIVKTLAGKAPPHVHVSTLHSLGYGNVRNALGNVTVEPRKVWYIIKDLMDGMAYDNAEKVDQSISSIVRLVSLCKAILQEPSDDTLDYIVDRWGIETNGDKEIIYEVVKTAFQISIEDTTTIDYDDMIFLSVTQVPCRQFDFLFVDETQDLNQSQLEMALRSVKPGGRIVAVGDENQSIYGFRGADTDAMPRIKEALKATVFPLSITYRCPKSHVELANTIVPELEAAEWAEDGILDSVSEYGFLDTVRQGDLVLCRTNAPLVRPAFSLIRQGVKAVILGRDIGKGLTSLIRKLQKRHRVRSLDDTLDALVEYRRKEMGRLVRLQKEMAAQNLDDKVETIIVLCEGCQTTAELERKIDQVFSDEHEGVTFSTVHKAKGGEADRVFILRPELMPHPMATKDWEQAQEWNIMYVAYTRAKKELYFVGAMPLFTTDEKAKQLICCRVCGECGPASELQYSEGDCPFTEDCPGIDEDIETCGPICGFCEGEGIHAIHIAIDEAESIYENCPICGGAGTADKKQNPPEFTDQKQDLAQLEGGMLEQERDIRHEMKIGDYVPPEQIKAIPDELVDILKDKIGPDVKIQATAHDLLAQFPHPGRLEGNIYRFSAQEICDALPGYEPRIDSGQLVLEHRLTEESTIVVYTSVKVGRIAGGTGEDSIRVTRRDVTPKQTFWYKDQYLYITRRVPQGSDPIAHIAAKVNEKARELFRDCPECGALQVKCKAGKGRDIRIWWKGCEHGGL